MKAIPASTIDEYIAVFPIDVQKILQEIRATIKKAAPGAKETIKYSMPCFTLNGNLVYFAAYKNHIGFYPTPTKNEEVKKELSIYKTGKGSVQFPLDKPMPLKLVEKMVRLRVEEDALRVHIKTNSRLKK